MAEPRKMSASDSKHQKGFRDLTSTPEVSPSRLTIPINKDAEKEIARLKEELGKSQQQHAALQQQLVQAQDTVREKEAIIQTMNATHDSLFKEMVDMRAAHDNDKSDLNNARVTLGQQEEALRDARPHRASLSKDLEESSDMVKETSLVMAILLDIITCYCDDLADQVQARMEDVDTLEGHTEITADILLRECPAADLGVIYEALGFVFSFSSPRPFRMRDQRQDLQRLAQRIWKNAER